jgi:hypothetical protein
MLMKSKFGGKCKTCNGPIVVGTPILWTRQDGARHADPKACVAAVEFMTAQRAMAPVVQTVARVEAGSVTGFLQAAKGRGLKAPKVRFLAPRGGELRLSLAGGNTHYPGAVQVKVDGVWVGRIEADGRLTPGLSNDPAMVETLTAVANDPAGLAKAYGALMGRCSFCGLTLTDAGSVEVGYGPICAENYGLPHTPKGTPTVKQVPQDDIDDVLGPDYRDVPSGRPGRLSAIVAQMERQAA